MCLPPERSEKNIERLDFGENKKLLEVIIGGLMAKSNKERSAKMKYKLKYSHIFYITLALLIINLIHVKIGRAHV